VNATAVKRNNAYKEKKKSGNKKEKKYIKNGSLSRKPKKAA
jgi:hypothetical protein